MRRCSNFRICVEGIEEGRLSILAFYVNAWNEIMGGNIFATNLHLPDSKDIPKVGQEHTLPDIGGEV